MFNTLNAIAVDNALRYDLFSDIGLMLYFPTDRMGEVVKLTGAVKLECWVCRDTEVRPQKPDIFRTGWSHALIRKDGQDAFTQFRYPVARLSLSEAMRWGRTLERFPQGDFEITRGANIFAVKREEVVS